MTKAPDYLHVSIHRECDNNAASQIVPHHGPLDGSNGQMYDWHKYLLSTPAREAAEDLLEALVDMTNFYVELVNSGDCGGMDDAETEIEVQAARKLITRAKGEA